MRLLLALAWVCVVAAGCGGKTTDNSSESTGGAAGAGGSGGASVGGSGGAGGTGGASTFPRACQNNGECSLHTDCCACLPLGAGEVAPKCDSPPCYVDDCGGKKIDTVFCASGQCRFGVSCNPQAVTCNGLPPACDPGMSPAVDVVTQCWTGYCIKTGFCYDVGSCDNCFGLTGLCVRAGTNKRCVDMPDECKSNPTCSCLQKYVCTAPNNYGCADLASSGGYDVQCLGAAVDAGI